MPVAAAFTRWEHRYGFVLLLILCSLVFQLIGQIYLVTIVAVIVGSLSRRRA